MNRNPYKLSTNPYRLNTFKYCLWIAQRDAVTDVFQQVHREVFGRTVPNGDAAINPDQESEGQGTSEA
jgi:hypothetical protein